MKKVTKIFLKDKFELLSDDEMKLVLGGSVYRCCCGMGDGTNYCFNYSADSWNQAAGYMVDVCYSGIGGCFE